MTIEELIELVHLLLMCGINDKSALESGNLTNEEWLQMMGLIDKFQSEKPGPKADPKSGDLISREALKKRLQEHKDFFINAYGSRHNFITNAPKDIKVRVDELNNCIAEVVNAPKVTFSLNLDNISDEQIQRFKMIWQRANSKGLLLINEPCYQTTSCLDCGNYDKENHNCPRYCEVIKEAINSRPRGEWKEVGGRYDMNSHRMIIECECDQCHRHEDFTQDDETGNVLTSHYCPHCGSSMWKEAEDDYFG